MVFLSRSFTWKMTRPKTITEPNKPDGLLIKMYMWIKRCVWTKSFEGEQKNHRSNHFFIDQIIQRGIGEMQIWNENAYAIIHMNVMLQFHRCSVCVCMICISILNASSVHILHKPTGKKSYERSFESSILFMPCRFLKYVWAWDSSKFNFDFGHEGKPVL